MTGPRHRRPDARERGISPSEVPADDSQGTAAGMAAHPSPLTLILLLLSCPGIRLPSSLTYGSPPAPRLVPTAA